jgi:hypothetical protein
VGNNPVNYVDPTGHRPTRSDDGGPCHDLGGAFDNCGAEGESYTYPSISEGVLAVGDVVSATVDGFASDHPVAAVGVRLVCSVCGWTMFVSAIGQGGKHLVQYSVVMLRGIAGKTPTEADFLSNAAKGYQPRGAELTDASLNEGISVFDSLDVATAKMARVRNVTQIAELEIPEGVGVLAKTLGPSHFTWWVKVGEAIETVIRVIPK